MANHQNDKTIYGIRTKTLKECNSMASCMCGRYIPLGYNFSIDSSSFD